jgi:hypothetical protein
MPFSARPALPWKFPRGLGGETGKRKKTARILLKSPREGRSISRRGIVWRSAVYKDSVAGFDHVHPDGGR